MKVGPTGLDEVLLIEHDVFADARGFFRETWNRQRYRESGLPEVEFVQANHSRSAKSVVRGLHFQRSRPQGKLVHVTNGSVFDVAVDVRAGSPTFGAWTGAELSADNGCQLWIPAGFAHGFCALSDDADLVYLCTEVYDADSDGGVIWDDVDIGIDWPVDDPVLSDKDARLPTLAEARDAGLLPGEAS